MPVAWSHVTQMSENDLELLRARAENVTLNVGDIIIDHIAEMRGILLKRIRHIDMIEDDIFLWDVKLFKNNNSDYTETIMEEEGLKSWLNSGVFSVGVGSKLFTNEIIKNKDWSLLESQSKKLVEIIKKIK